MINYQDIEAVAALKYNNLDDEHFDKARFICCNYRVVRLEEAKIVVDEYLERAMK